MTLEQDPTVAPAGSIEAVCAVLHSLGYVIANTNLYGIQHKVTQSKKMDSLTLLRNYFKEFGAIDIAMHPDGFLVHNTPIGGQSSPTQLLRGRLSGLGIDNLTLLPELQDVEFDNLINLLAKPSPKVGDTEACLTLIEAARFTNIKTAKYTYQRLAEDETVTTLSDETPDAEAEAAAREAIVKQIFSYLTGDAPTDADLSSLCNRSDTADLLAQGILDAVGRSDPNGQATAASLTEALQRACAGMMLNPSSRTQKGRQNVKRILQQVETKLKDQITGNAHAEEASEAISTTVEDLTESLEIEGVVTRFIKQKALAQASEERLRRQVRRASKDETDLEVLREKLFAAGLTEDDWETLVIGGDDAPVDDATAREAAAARAARLLSLVENLKQASTANADGSRATDTASSQALILANQQVNESIGDAHAKIQTLKTLLAHPPHPEHEKSSNRITKRKLRNVLAELGQELRQPLTVINATISMTLKKHQAEAPDDPVTSLLELAASSGDQMDILIERMVEIAGFPKELTPDSAILDSLYHRGPKSP